MIDNMYLQSVLRQRGGKNGEDVSEDKSIKLGWTVAEKVMRTVKPLAKSPVKEILGGILIKSCMIKPQRLDTKSFKPPLSFPANQMGDGLGFSFESKNDKSATSPAASLHLCINLLHSLS